MIVLSGSQLHISSHISWYSSEHDWTRLPNMVHLFMLGESHFVHWLLYVQVQVRPPWYAWHPTSEYLDKTINQVIIRTIGSCCLVTTWNWISSFMFLESLYVNGHILFGQDCLSKYRHSLVMLYFIKLHYKAGCHIYVSEIILCTWTHTIIIVHHGWSHTVCIDTNCFGHNCIACQWNCYFNGVRAWAYMEQWSSSTTLHHYWTRLLLDKIVGQVRRHSSTTSHTTSFIGGQHRHLRSSMPTFIFVYDYNFNFYIHLPLRRLQFCCRHSLHCAASNARLRVVLVCKYRASSDTYRSSRLCSLHRSPIPDATIDWCWSNTTPHLHTVPFLIHVHRTAPLAVLALCVFALHRGNARRFSAILWNILIYIA